MAFSQAVSGLNAAATNLDVIGNNIANSATYGFKSGTASLPICLPVPKSVWALKLRVLLRTLPTVLPPTPDVVWTLLSARTVFPYGRQQRFRFLQP